MLTSASGAVSRPPATMWPGKKRKGGLPSGASCALRGEAGGVSEISLDQAALAAPEGRTTCHSACHCRCSLNCCRPCQAGNPQSSRAAPSSSWREGSASPLAGAGEAERSAERARDLLRERERDRVGLRDLPRLRLRGGERAGERPREGERAGERPRGLRERERLGLRRRSRLQRVVGARGTGEGGAAHGWRQAGTAQHSVHCHHTPNTSPGKRAQQCSSLCDAVAPLCTSNLG